MEVDQSKTVNVLLRCLKGSETECIHLCSAIIHKALCAKEEFCPNVSTSEDFIQPTDAIKYPLKPTTELNLFSISEITAAIAEAKPCVFGNKGLLLNLEKLLYFEPYAHLSMTVLQKLFDEEQSSCVIEVTEEFLCQKAQCSHTKLNYFATMLELPIQNAIDQASLDSAQAMV